MTSEEIQSTLDEHKLSLPEGLYLKLSNLLMKKFKEDDKVLAECTV